MSLLPQGGKKLEKVLNSFVSENKEIQNLVIKNATPTSFGISHAFAATFLWISYIVFSPPAYTATYVPFKSSLLLFQNVSKQASLTARHEVLRSLIKNP